MKDDHSKDGPAPERQRSVIDEVARLTGTEPSKILLRDSDSAAGTESPFLDPKSPEKKLLPKGRGNYQILGEIARGGMGVILKSHDHDLGRDVALKVLDPELAKQEAIVQRFVEEAQVAGQLQHPGIVPVYEMGLMEDKRPYFTMKLIKGRTMAAMLSARKTLEDDRRRLLSIFESICQTVAYAHSKGVIHRDLKPANIMVGAFGEVQVVDWGLAKVLRGGGVADEIRAKHSNLTVIETVRSGPGSSGSQSMVGSVMGTPAYMPPEQAMGEIAKLDERADVFSLGAILCEIMTGKPPYLGADEDGDRTVVQAAQARLDPARGRVADCKADEELKRLCLACLTPAREARPSNAAEVAHSIHEYLATLEERTHKAQVAAAEAVVKAAEERRARKLTLALAGAVLIAIAGVGGLFYVQDAHEKERLAGVEADVDEAQSEVLTLQASGRFEDALDLALTTVGLIKSADAGGALLKRAERLEEQARNQIAEEEERLAYERKNKKLLDRLEELRIQQVELFGNLEESEMDVAYAEAFREYGIDVDKGELTDILDELRASGIGGELALGLDDWAAMRREMHGNEAWEVESLTALAFDLDPDPLRTQMREAFLRNESEPLLELVETGDAPSMPPGTIWVLVDALNEFGKKDIVQKLAIEAVEQHPDDFRLNFLAGVLRRGQYDYVPAMRYLSAARSLRPNNAQVHHTLGNLHWNLRDLLASTEAYAEAHRLDPEIGGYTLWGWSHLLLGEYGPAVERFEVSLERNLEAPWAKANLLVARVFRGDAPLAELLRLLESNPNPPAAALRNVSFTLIDHPDSSQRDPEKAVELMRPVVERYPYSSVNLSVFAACLIRAGQPQEALEILERETQAIALGTSNLLALHSYKRAVAFYMLGEAERAESSLEDGDWYRKRAEQRDPERWAGCWIAKWAEEAHALKDG